MHLSIQGHFELSRLDYHEWCCHRRVHASVRSSAFSSGYETRRGFLGHLATSYSLLRADFDVFILIIEKSIFVLFCRFIPARYPKGTRAITYS